MAMKRFPKIAKGDMVVVDNLCSRSHLIDLFR